MDTLNSILLSEFACRRFARSVFNKTIRVLWNRIALEAPRISLSTAVQYWRLAVGVRLAFSLSAVPAYTEMAGGVNWTDLCWLRLNWGQKRAGTRRSPPLSIITSQRSATGGSASHNYPLFMSQSEREIHMMYCSLALLKWQLQEMFSKNNDINVNPDVQAVNYVEWTTCVCS